MDTFARQRPPYPTAKARNVAAIPEVLREFAADVPWILRTAGLDQDVFADLEQVMPFASLGRLLAQCVKATGCESFGLRVGARTKLNSLGLTSLVLINAPTVRDALLVINDTLKTSETGGATYLEARDGLASFGYTVVAPNIEAVDQIEDGSLAIAFKILRRVCGPPWRPILVRLARNPPRDKAPFQRFFEAPVEFGAPSTCLIFDAATLDEPVRGSDADAAEILAPLLREAAASAQGDFVSTVRSMIRTQLAAGSLSREGVWRALGLSGRTFGHRLEALGLTYTGLADEAKYEVAQALLRKGETIAKTAARLGFADSSAFTRAFKAWSGKTPARWRAERVLANE